MGDAVMADLEIWPRLRLVYILGRSPSSANTVLSSSVLRTRSY